MLLSYISKILHSSRRHPKGKSTLDSASEKDKYNSFLWKWTVRKRSSCMYKLVQYKDKIWKISTHEIVFQCMNYILKFLHNSRRYPKEKKHPVSASEKDKYNSLLWKWTVCKTSSFINSVVQYKDKLSRKKTILVSASGKDKYNSFLWKRTVRKRSSGISSYSIKMRFQRFQRMIYLNLIAKQLNKNHTI